MPDMSIEMKEPNRYNLIKRFKDMLDGTYAEQVYIANTPNVIEMRPVTNTLVTTSFSAATQAALMVAVNAYLAGSNKRFITMNQYCGGLVSLFFYATVIEMPA